MKAIDDKGLIPEEELIENFWPQKMQPKTSPPVIVQDNRKIINLILIK